MTEFPLLNDIRVAARLIAHQINHTPLMSSRQVNKKCQAEVIFKCENFQRVGAFKFRGASNAVLSLSEKEARAGVVTHSSGNHAQALALAAKIRNIPAYIVMPENAPQVKINAVADYGAKIRFCKPTLEARETTAADVVNETGATFIHPYDDARIIAGQGTAALELLQEHPDLDVIMAPVGGGGLVSGTSIVAKALNKKIMVLGAEPELANDAWLSLKNGKRYPAQNLHTIADGLRTALSDLTFSIIQKYVDDIVTVDEKSIIEAMHFMWERMKIIIEPSSAVPVAVLFRQSKLLKKKKIGIILSGGNVDLQKLPWQ